MKISFSLPIPYIQNRFYNERIEVASVPKSTKNTDFCRSGVFYTLNIEDSFYS